MNTTTDEGGNPRQVALTEGLGLVERAEFEAWAKDQGFPLETLDGFCSDAVAYRDLRTQGAWEGFSVGVAAERERCRPLVEQCRAALAEELSAWDIDPPLHHVKTAHDACVAWLKA